MVTITRSRNGQNGIVLSPAELTQLKTAFGGNQVLADAIANLVKRNQATVVSAPVYDKDDETFVHKYCDDDGNNLTVNLMIEAQLLTFYRNVMKLDDTQIQELKTKGLEYPRDFALFDSDLVEATIKSMRSKDLALGGLSQMLLKQFVTLCNTWKYAVESASLVF